jgi:hypothetical protein
MNQSLEASTSARERFERLIAFDNVLTQDGFRLASEAEYAEVLQSIEDHKYLTNEKIPFEISMEQALFSWCENVYHPVMYAIDEAGLVYAFPEATRAELFLWVTRHWHYLKQELHPGVSIDAAVQSFGRQFGTGLFARLLNRIKAIAA